jgi:hypothetical protein
LAKIKAQEKATQDLVLKIKRKEEELKKLQELGHRLVMEQEVIQERIRAVQGLVIESKGRSPPEGWGSEVMVMRLLNQLNEAGVRRGQAMEKAIQCIEYEKRELNTGLKSGLILASSMVKARGASEG